MTKGTQWMQRAEVIARSLICYVWPLCSVPLCAAVLLNIYFILNCFMCDTSLQEAVSVESEGTYPA